MARPRSSFPAHLLAALVVLAGLSALASCGSTAPDKRILQYLNTDGFGKRYTGNAEEENYVTINDSIVWTDSFHPEVGGSGRVDIDGTVLIPEAGAVHVAGLTRSEIEGLLTQKLSPYYEQNDVKVVIAASQKFYYIIGECAVTGQVPFRGGPHDRRGGALRPPDPQRVQPGAREADSGRPPGALRAHRGRGGDVGNR